MKRRTPLKEFKYPVMAKVLPWWEKEFGFDKNKIMEHTGMNQSEVDHLIKKRISEKKESSHK